MENEIGIHAARERIQAYPGIGIDDKMVINSIGLTIDDGSGEKTVEELFMGINSTCNFLSLGIDSSDTGNFSCSDLHVRNWYDSHPDTGSFSNFDDEFDEFLQDNASDIINETLNLMNNTNATFQGTLFNVTLQYFEERHGISFTNPDQGNEGSWEDFFGTYYNESLEHPYVWILEDPWNNPSTSENFPIFNTVSNLGIWSFLGYNVIVESWFYKFSIITYIIRIITNFFQSDDCKGIILYDFNNHTHNMVNTQMLGPIMSNNIFSLMGLPLIFINGTIGREINASVEDYTIDFHRDQSYDDSVLSYNVIGTIYGADPSKTVIVSSLYDSWWNQGTTDSAIGMSIVLGIAKYFKENNIVPKYNLKFIAFGGEEYGYLGAISYEARHKDEDIVAVIDLNQLGFEERTNVTLNFTIYVNNNETNSTVNDIAQRTQYENRTFHHANFTTSIVDEGAPSNDGPFAKKRGDDGIQTMCFLKDTGWTLHHRDGKNESNEPHSDGDVMDYYNETYVSVVAEMVLNVTKYFAGESYILCPGWNMITVPLKNDWTASTLAENISGCQMVGRFDAEFQVLRTYIVGVPVYDFSIQDGFGYFVLVEDYTTFSLTGNPIFEDSVQYYEGWNMIGWYQDQPTTASSLAENITNCKMVSWFDAEYQVLRTHIVATPAYDFNITKGMGLFILVDDGRKGDSGFIGVPHPIYGQAYFSNSSVPADNANMTLINLNTSKNVTTIVGDNVSSWYQQDLSNLPSGWSNGDIIRIIVNGTGSYEGWTNTTEIIADNSTHKQLLPDIICYYPSATEITNVTNSPDTVGFGFNISISADVVDTVNDIAHVKVNITYPDNTSINVSMNNTENNTYNYVFSDTWQHGQYNYTIYAKNIAGYSNNSSIFSFNVSANATISVCTIKNSYGSNESLNLTDPPGSDNSYPVIGYDLLDNNSVLHIWNEYDSYYFNTSSGIQLTNHYDEYWSHNVLMLGYYNNDEWHVIYRTDELSGFNKNIDTDNTSYINVTLRKDLAYNGYEFRLAIRYHLGVDDNELTIIPYIKNLGDPIPYVLGFAWEINDIMIDMTGENDYILINDTDYLLNETLDLTFTNLSRPVYCWNETLNDTVICGYEPLPYFYIRENLTGDTSKSLYMRWNPGLNYRVWVKSRNNSYNAPVVLGIRIGTLASGQSKQTTLYWYDASEVTYYFNKYSVFESWETNPRYMVDNQLGNYASTDEVEIERCTSNSCPKDTDPGRISKVELRVYGYRQGASCSIVLRPVFMTGDGDFHEYVLPSRAAWSDWYDITDDTNAPDWVWSSIGYLDCDVISYDFHPMFLSTAYCSKVEVRITYTPWTPPCITNPSPSHGSTNITITPTVGITVTDVNNESFDITWWSNSSGSWEIFGTNNSVNNGTYYQTFDNATVNGQWWYWMVNVSDGRFYNESNIFKFYTGVQSKISNTGSTGISGYLLIQVHYNNDSEWILDLEVINDTAPRVINSSEELSLDTVFNGLVNTDDLSNGNGTYRVYAAFRDPYGNVLICDDETELEAWWKFDVDTS